MFIQYLACKIKTSACGHAIFICKQSSPTHHTTLHFSSLFGKIGNLLGSPRQMSTCTHPNLVFESTEPTNWRNPTLNDILHGGPSIKKWYLHGFWRSDMKVSSSNTWLIGVWLSKTLFESKISLPIKLPCIYSPVLVKTIIYLACPCQTSMCVHLILICEWR